MRLLIAGLLVAVASAADSPPQELTRISTPADAVALALADAQQHQQTNYRYIWIPDGSIKSMQVITATLNIAMNHGPVAYRPTILHPTLLRIDLNELGAGEVNTRTLFATWEDLAKAEPYFLVRLFEQTTTSQVVIATSDIRSGDIVIKSGSVIPQDTLDHWKAVKYTPRNVRIETSEGKAASQVVLAAPHCELDMLALQELTLSTVPIVEWRYFLTKALSTIEGGLYYKFRSMPTTQTGLLESLGADQKAIEKQRSDQRVAMFRSNVTGKPRTVVMFTGTAGRPGVCQGLISITEDPFDEDIGPEFDPIRNLLGVKFSGTELIAEMPNGFHLYALFDAEGNLVDEAPPNLVSDHTIPEPYTRRLQPAISCIRCHARTEEMEGWQPMRNDVTKLLKLYLDVYGDLNSPSVPDAIPRMVGLYSGNLDKPLRRSRDDHAEVMLRATSHTGIPGISVYEAYTGIAEAYNDYNYRLVSPTIALSELGYVTENQDTAQLKLRELLALPVNTGTITAEDPVLAALQNGIYITRKQFEQVYADAALRSNINQQTEKQNATAK